MPLSTKLGELKTILANEDHFGPISVDHERLFYLGRELKSSGRSLMKLGIGKFKTNRVLHLHVRPEGRTIQEVSSSKSTKRQRKKLQPRKKPVHNNNSNDTVVDLLDDSDDEVTMIENPNDRDKRPRVS